MRPPTHQKLLGIWLTLALLLGVTGNVRAGDEPAPLPEINLTGFTRIFDGETLEDWDGDPIYWTVENGHLVGTITPETLLSKNSWIVWRGGLVEDFELVLDYRVSVQGNSGIGYRLAVLEDDPFSVRGPQADIQGGDMFTGICYEENGRRLLAARGQRTQIGPGELPRLVSQFADPEELQSVVRKEEWNRYHLIVRGHHAQHFINGVLMSEIHDVDEQNRMTHGLLGVQVHVGPPMTIEYRDIFLKHLGPPPEGTADRDDIVYASGSLLEREHQPTFENLSNQAARVSAATVTEPLNGQTELVIEEARLAIVRHGLIDVELFGGSVPLSEEESLDLVVISGDETVRVPEAGRLWEEIKPEATYRVELQWNPERGGYEVVSLTETE